MTFVLFDGGGGFIQDIPEPSPFPLAVHDGAVSPVNAADLLDACTHRVSTVAGALKCTCNFILRKSVSDVLNRKL